MVSSVTLYLTSGKIHLELSLSVLILISPNILSLKEGFWGALVKLDTD
jgi:hypothetical protein